MLVLLLLVLVPDVSYGWLTPRRSLPVAVRSRRQPLLQTMMMNSNNNRFSKKAFLEKPAFDPLSLRSFRQETLLQYDATNQSEPLRILLYAFATFVLLASPSFGDLFGNAFGAPALAGAAASACGTGFLFNRERLRRASQLIRLEREAALGDLKVVVTEIDRLGGGAKRVALTLRELRGDRRVIILYGSAQVSKFSRRRTLDTRQCGYRT